MKANSQKQRYLALRNEIEKHTVFFISKFSKKTQRARACVIIAVIA